MGLREVRVTSLEELQGEISRHDEDSLFRGQTKDYRDAVGRPTFPTSMARKGCVPPLQYKWSQYAYWALRSTVPDATPDPEHHREQALLQHYGWRSFFIDVTSNPAVAAWFAAHAFEDEGVWNFSEDCHGNSVATLHQNAAYSRHTDEGHIYVVSKSLSEAAGIKAFDLRGITLDGARLRMNAQHAWLLGPLSPGLPAEAVTTHIVGPADVFAGYAERSGLKTTHDLFPTREEDPLLELFLSVPWEAPPVPHGKEGLPMFFARALRLPEYDHRYVDRHPPNIAFYRPYWVSDWVDSNDELAKATTFFRVPELLFYMGRRQKAAAMPDLISAVDQSGRVIMESAHLIREPPFHSDVAYMKGIAVQRQGDLLEVSEMGVDHAGTLAQGAWVNAGWYYRVDADGAWTRVQHPDGCPCKSHVRHENHLSALMMLDTMIGNGNFRRIRDQVFEFVEPR